MIYSNHDIYYGEFKDGRKHGWGVYKFFSGSVYEGPWERGRLHGIYPTLSHSHSHTHTL
jgi:hypothetical protein